MFVRRNITKGLIDVKRKPHPGQLSEVGGRQIGSRNRFRPPVYRRPTSDSFYVIGTNFGFSNLGTQTKDISRIQAIKYASHGKNFAQFCLGRNAK